MPQSNAIKYKFIIWIWSLFCTQIFYHTCLLDQLDKKLQQKTFKNNSNRLRTNIDPFRGVSGFPVETIMKADTKLILVMCCQIFDERYTAPSSGDILRWPPRPRPVDWASASWRASILPTGFCIFLSIIFIFFFFCKVFNYIYFKAIQTVVFYQQKNMYKMFRPNFLMFLDLKVSWDLNKN